MICEINHDPIFLSQKSAEATADDVHIAVVILVFGENKKVFNFS